MTRLTQALLLVLTLCSVAQPVAARPNFLTLFQQDPLRNAAVDGCGTCHVNPRGGGPRNDFGLEFAAEEFKITPMLRSSFPDRFQVRTAEIEGFGKFYFADTEGKVVVYEKDGQKHAIDLAAAMQAGLTAAAAGATGPAAPNADAAPAEAEDVAPRHKINNFSFFITSVGLGQGGNLGGLAGADRHCQVLANAVDAGHKTWRAYLSTSFDGKPAVNAGDRIGSGPWFNSRGVMVAHGIADLHSPDTRFSKERALNENGELVKGREDTPNQHDVLTGTLPNGTAAVDMNCSNWTSSSEGVAMLGHFDRQGGGDNPTSWNAAHTSRSCSQEDLRATGGEGFIYCFATGPND